MDINSVIVKKILENIDLSEYEGQIRGAVADYFQSSHFKENIAESIDDCGIGWEIGQKVSEKIIKQIKKLNISITFKE